LLAAVLIFTATYLVLAVGRIPFLRVDRTGAAIVGASLMLAFNVLTVEEAYAAINYDTIILLFGMMIVVANLRVSGFFGLVSAWVVRHTHGPLALLAAIVAVSGVFSAFFVNDTMCLVLTPLVLEVARALKLRPTPYLLAVAMASNAGSVATITGNPQNMLIGSLSGISYREFAWTLAPVGAVSLIITFAVIACLYRVELRSVRRVEVEELRTRVLRPMVWKSAIVSAGMVAGFFYGWPVSQVAIVAGALLMLTRRVKPERIYREIDFPLLVLFAGLFIVVAGVEKTSLEQDLLRMASGLRLDNVGILSGLSAVLSNLVSNVPAVLVFRPVVHHLANPKLGWLTLAMSSTLAGNLTILGSVANLIVVERARRDVVIGFWEYLRAGVPVTLLSLAAGIAWLMW